MLVGPKVKLPPVCLGERSVIAHYLSYAGRFWLTAFKGRHPPRRAEAAVRRFPYLSGVARRQPGRSRPRVGQVLVQQRIPTSGLVESSGARKGKKKIKKKSRL